jgi:hypothetical protein
MIEHPFDSVKAEEPGVRARDGPKIVAGWTKQNRPVRRLTAVKRDASSLLAAMLRIGFMVGLAALLILVLLPAAMAAQAAGLR